MRTMRAMALIAGRVFTRRRPPTADEIADRARAQREATVATDYEKAIARELAARGRAAHLYRTEGESQAARRAAREHTSAERYREDMETTLFQLRAHRTVPAT